MLVKLGISLNLKSWMSVLEQSLGKLLFLISVRLTFCRSGLPDDVFGPGERRRQKRSRNGDAETNGTTKKAKEESKQ
jgi:poly(A) polymerase Pap1